MKELNQSVIELHNISRQVEAAFGICKLSVEMRRIADDLSKAINPISITEYTCKGDQ